MGKHSLEDDRVFWRSVMFFALKWMGVVALPLIAAWGIWRLIREPNQNPVAPAVVSQESPTTVASPPPSPSPTAAPSPTSSPTTRGPVQVLNGSGQTGQARRAADRLEQAGFQIVAVGNAANRVERTTVFFKPGFQDLAEQVAEALGTTTVEPAPPNLEGDVAVTAVVGPDLEG